MTGSPVPSKPKPVVIPESEERAAVPVELVSAALVPTEPLAAPGGFAIPVVPPLPPLVPEDCARTAVEHRIWDSTKPIAIALMATSHSYG